jgi:hypothetical protein
MSNFSGAVYCAVTVCVLWGNNYYEFSCFFKTFGKMYSISFTILHHDCTVVFSIGIQHDQMDELNHMNITNMGSMAGIACIFRHKSWQLPRWSPWTVDVDKHLTTGSCRCKMCTMHLIYPLVYVTDS